MTCKDGRFNTGNPICSNKPQDLHDNAMIIDAFTNSDADFVEDRFGVERKTIAGIEKQANEQIQKVDDKLGGIDQEIADKIIAQGGVEIINDWDQASDENVFSAGFVKDGLGYVTPEMFGAVGDGVTDDLASLQDAFQAHDKILLRGTYMISDTLKVAKESLTITGGGKILYPYQVENAVEIKTNSTYLVRSLASPTVISTHEWVVDDVTGLEEGMLMEVVSSIPWSFDPREETTDARKSELHKVTAIKDGKIYTELPAQDGYLHKDGETVQVKFINPITLDIQSINIEMKLDRLGTSAKRRTCLVVSNAVNSRIKINAKFGANAGIGLRNSYNSVVDNSSSSHHNNYYSGYGAFISASTLCGVTNSHFTHGRRGVDVSGDNLISRLCYVRNNTVTGGGYNSRGEEYGWTATGVTGASNYGVGSHGAACDTYYSGNLIIDVHTPFSVRGGNEVIQGNKVKGRTRRGVVSAGYGYNLKVMDNVIEGVIDDFRDFTNAGNRYDYSALHLVDIGSAHGGGDIVIENNVSTVSKSLIHFHDLKSWVGGLTIGLNSTSFRPRSTTFDTYYVTTDNAPDNPVNRFNINVGTYDRIPSDTGSVKVLEEGVLLSPRSKVTIPTTNTHDFPVTNLLKPITGQVNINISAGLAMVYNGTTWVKLNAS